MRQFNNLEPVHICMLGEFSITVGDKQIRDTVARTHQLWHLIEYLIAFRNMVITQDELIEVLWPEGNIDNPANALKNLVYRVRSALSSHGLPHARDMIIYSRGGYRWNNSLNCIVDSEEFEQLYALAISPDQPLEQQIQRYFDVIKIYKGDFLPGARFEGWVIPIATTYRSKFFQCVYALCDILEQQERYEELEAVCRKAIDINQFEEPAHRYLILSLIKQGKQSQAMVHYGAVTELFFRELGVSPSRTMRSLYRDIVKKTHDVEVDLSIIKEDLQESDSTEGTFYCEYEVFKNLYRLEARTAARTGQSIFIALVTLEDADGDVLEVKVQNKMMDSLYSIIQSSLRKGDVFARFSASQYVLMLPSLNYENCAMVMDRIAKRFRHLHRNKNVSIFYKIQPLDPIDI